MQERYLEFYAKVIIEAFFNISLEVKDRPDLQNEKENIGIEVTSAENINNKEIESLGCTLSENRARNIDNAIKKITTLGGKYNKYCIMEKSISHEENKNEIYKALTKKLEKLNTIEFKKFNENNICIFSTMHKITQEEQKEFLKKINKIQSSYKNRFNKIYLLLLHSIYEFNLNTNKITIKNFTSEQQYNYSIIANEMIN